MSTLSFIFISILSISIRDEINAIQSPNTNILIIIKEETHRLSIIIVEWKLSGCRAKSDDGMCVHCEKSSLIKSKYLYAEYQARKYNMNRSVIYNKTPSKASFFFALHIYMQFLVNTGRLVRSLDETKTKITDLVRVKLSILQSRYQQDISNLLKLFSVPEISRVEISRQQ